MNNTNELLFGPMWVLLLWDPLNSQISADRKYHCSYSNISHFLHYPPDAAPILLLQQLDTLWLRVPALMCGHGGRCVAFRRFWFSANRERDTIAPASPGDECISVLAEQRELCPKRCPNIFIISHKPYSEEDGTGDQTAPPTVHSDNHSELLMDKSDKQ